MLIVLFPNLQLHCHHVKPIGYGKLAPPSTSPRQSANPLHILGLIRFGFAVGILDIDSGIAHTIGY